MEDRHLRVGLRPIDIGVYFHHWFQFGERAEGLVAHDSNTYLALTNDDESALPSYSEMS
jgi:hypothetical protein